jgi:hypothetical protein
MSIAIFDERAVLFSAIQIVLADATNYKVLSAQNLGDRRIDDILISMDAVASRVVEFYVNTSGARRILASVTVPPGSGYAGVAPVQLSSLVEPTHQAGWLFTSPLIVECRVTLTMGAAENVDVIALGGYF